MSYAKINARQIIDMNFKGKMIKLLLEENIRGYLYNLRVGKISYIGQKKNIKKNIDKLDHNIKKQVLE